VDIHPHSLEQHPPAPADTMAQREHRDDHLLHPYSHGQHLVLDLDALQLQGSQHGPAVQTGTSSSPTGSKKYIIKKKNLFTEAEETTRISCKIDPLVGNKPEESIEPYLSENGRRAWQEHTASSPSSLSWSVGDISSSPGRNIKGLGRGNARSADTPVVLKVKYIKAYHKHHLPDCRQTFCNENGKKDDENCGERKIGQQILEQQD
jgi:hypothetical protein